MAGLPPSLASWLAPRLGMAVAAASTGREALDGLDAHDVALLILDHNLADPPALHLLEQARTRLRLDHLEVIYCLDEAAGRKLPRRLVTEFGVADVLFHPVDPLHLAERAASILGVPLSAASDEAGLEPVAPPVESVMATQLATVWKRAGARTLERLETLEAAGGELLEGRLSPAQRGQAEREAHRLAGSLGMFGFERASRFAREIEHLLRQGTRLSETQTLRLSELIVALRLDIEQQITFSAAGKGSAGPLDVLVITADGGLAERLAEEALARELAVRSVPDVASARQSLGQTLPGLVLLDVSTPTAHDATLELLSELGGRTPRVPVVVLTATGALTDRVEVARRGALGFLPKSLSAPDIFDAVTRMVEHSSGTRTRVLAVDDDPAVLARLEALLAPQGTQITGLSDPLHFWETLEQCAPELVILDVDMPHLSGIELCRVLRNDPRWCGVPVIVLTAYRDAGLVNRVFASGADDFVAKPVVGPELVTRISNRLERTRLLRTVAETDALTGLANRRKSTRMLQDFLRLAEQHAQPFSLALAHIDHLQDINRQHGYAAGDEVMRRLGRLLQRAFRSQDVVARWAGDEFVIGMYGLSRGDGVQRLAEVLENLRGETFPSANSTSFPASFSAGVAQYPDDAGDLESLYRVADEARRKAERAGGDRVLPAGWSPEQKEKLRRLDVVLALADEAQAALLLHALETRGYRARDLRDGKVAARMLTAPEADWRAKVVVLDADLPGLDGLALLGQLAAGGFLEHSRAIVLTSPTAGDEAATAVELGAFDQVAKPFSLPVLVNRIRRALES
jgi:diguanylate cyclase (GGDEF)-like protein